MDLLIILTLGEEVCIFEAKLQECDNLLYGHFGCCCNFCLTMLMEGSMRTEVKRTLTSHGVITSPGSTIISMICCTKCWLFLRWCGD